MKVLGIKQFHQKKYKLLDIKGTAFENLLGKVPMFFIAIIYGFSGNGKTEFCVRLAKLFSRFGKVAWLSYEQRHGFDLQQATTRNKMEENVGNFLVIDPIANIKEGVSLLEDLDKYLSAKNSPRFIFFDSIDYTGFTWEDYVFLKNKYGHKKGLFFISHSTKNGALKKRISEKILFDGGMGLFVKDFICTPEKNRFGGLEPYVIYEPEARKRNPAFFTKRLQEETPTKPTKKRAKKAVNE